MDDALSLHRAFHELLRADKSFRYESVVLYAAQEKNRKYDA